MLIDASPWDRWWQDTVSAKTFDTHAHTHAHTRTRLPPLSLRVSLCEASTAAAKYCVIFVILGTAETLMAAILRKNLHTL